MVAMKEKETERKKKIIQLEAGGLLAKVAPGLLLIFPHYYKLLPRNN